MQRFQKALTQNKEKRRVNKWKYELNKPFAIKNKS